MNKDKLRDMIDEVLDSMLEDVYKTIDNKVEKNNDKTEKFFYRVAQPINGLIEEVKNLKEYINAVKFLNWFKWSDIHSKELVIEAKNKLIKDIPDCYTSVYSFNKLDTDKLKYDEKEEAFSAFATYTDWGCISYSSANHRFEVGNTDTDLYLCGNKIEIKSKEPEHEYGEYVKALVARPFDYQESDCVKVAKYLKSILDTSDTLDKYRD